MCTLESLRGIFNPSFDDEPVDGTRDRYIAARDQTPEDSVRNTLHLADESIVRTAKKSTVT